MDKETASLLLKLMTAQLAEQNRLVARLIEFVEAALKANKKSESENAKDD